MLSNVGLAPSLLLLLSHAFVKWSGLPLLNAERASGAAPQAEAGPIAKLIAHHASLAVNQLNRALGTWRHAQTTAIAQLFVDMHYLSDWHILPQVSIARAGGEPLDGLT